MRSLPRAFGVLLGSTIPLAAQSDTTPLLSLEARSTYRSWSTPQCSRWTELHTTRFIDHLTVVLEETTQILRCETHEGARASVRVAGYASADPGKRPLWSFTQEGERGRVLYEGGELGELYEVDLPGSGGADNARVCHSLRDGSRRFEATLPLLEVPGDPRVRAWVAIHAGDTFLSPVEEEPDSTLSSLVQFGRATGPVQRLALRGPWYAREAEIVAREGLVLRVHVGPYDHVVDIPLSHADGLDWRSAELP